MKETHLEKQMKGKALIVKVETMLGMDTQIVARHGETKKPVYMIVDNETGKEIDNGYRSYKEAKETYPNAIN